MLGMWDVGNMGCSGCGIFRVWDVRGVRDVGCSDVGCLGCGTFGMWDVRDKECSGCGMLEMWEFGDVGLWGCGMLGMFGMRDIRDVRSSKMWDVRDVEF